jgi:carbamoyltransferase
MLIVGLNAFHPDSAACVLKDGELVAAVAEERLGPRRKHVAGFPARALAEALRMRSCRRNASVLFFGHEHIG